MEGRTGGALDPTEVQKRVVKRRPCRLGSLRRRHAPRYSASGSRQDRRPSFLLSPPPRKENMTWMLIESLTTSIADALIVLVLLLPVKAGR